jgi:hypothetical protein
MLLVHKDVLASFKASGIENLWYEFEDKSISLSEIMKKEFYSASGGQRDYNSLKEYQEGLEKV